jgi:hypothetical protein
MQYTGSMPANCNAKIGTFPATDEAPLSAVPLARRAKDASIVRLLGDLIKGRAPAVAAALTERTGQRITPNMIYFYCSQGKPDSRFPAEFLEPLSDILLDDRLLRHVLGPRRRRVYALGEIAEVVLGKRAAANLLRPRATKRPTQKRAPKSRARKTRKGIARARIENKGPSQKERTRRHGC